ncbi:MAG: hypothetical protein ABSA31_03645 [Acidimicrobiales bacterium]
MDVIAQQGRVGANPVPSTIIAIPANADNWQTVCSRVRATSGSRELEN